MKLPAALLRRCRTPRRRPDLPRRLSVEQLEARALLDAVPWGAQPQDTAEFMLGSVTVTPVFLESNGQLDPSTEDWSAAQIAATKQKIQEAMSWWQETLRRKTAVHGLDFHYDFTYADSPVPTRYEPISRPSDDESLWVSEFLAGVGFGPPTDIVDGILGFNHAQRVKNGTNWAFTIFVANSANDSDGKFDLSGSFDYAFAYPGGQYIVAPSTRPVISFTHETGHIFWARDEYAGGGNYNERRGYYDTQNLNAVAGAPPGFVQQDSIMASGAKMTNAYANFTSAPSTLAQLGWQDSDGDGVFDVLDVPHTLRGTGYYDSRLNKYRFVGHAAVGALPNRNSSGLQSDITINTITQAEYRLDGGTWKVAATYGTYEADLDLRIALPFGVQQVEIRTVTLDPVTQQLVSSSDIFAGQAGSATEMQTAGIHGLVWNDLDADGNWDTRETGLPQQIVRLVDGQGQLLNLQTVVDADAFGDSDVLNNMFPGITLSTTGLLAEDSAVLSRATTLASTGGRIFANRTSRGTARLTWVVDTREFKAEFATPQSYVALDAVGPGVPVFARLEAYDASGKLLARYDTGELGSEQVETMVLSRSVADIAYIKAFGRHNAQVVLDNLRVGPAAQTVSETGGGFWFGAVPAGAYAVQIVAPASVQSTTPASGRQDVAVGAGSPGASTEFGIRFQWPWRNPLLPTDVNADERSDLSDVVLLVRQLSHQGGKLPEPTDAAGPPAFWDANGDGNLSLLDVRAVLRDLAAGGNGEPSGPAATGGGGGSSSPPEGEGRRRATIPVVGRVAIAAASDVLGTATGRVEGRTPVAATARHAARDTLYAALATERGQLGTISSELHGRLLRRLVRARISPVTHSSLTRT